MESTNILPGGGTLTRLWEPYVLTALILVCSLAVTPDLSDCSRSNAFDTMYVPEQFANPATCFMHGKPIWPRPRSAATSVRMSG